MYFCIPLAWTPSIDKCLDVSFWLFTSWNI